MISKGIKKWPTELISDTLPNSYSLHFERVFDLEISISTSHIVRQDIEFGVSVFYYINKQRTFEFSTISKFKFSNPLHEEATLQFGYGCVKSAITDFNELISKHKSELAYVSGEAIQHPMPDPKECKELIHRIWKLNLPMN